MIIGVCNIRFSQFRERALKQLRPLHKYLTVTCVFLSTQQKYVPITGDTILIWHSKGIAVFDEINKLRLVRYVNFMNKSNTLFSN